MIGREKGKTPFVEEDELDPWSGIYEFEEMLDIEEITGSCPKCGGYLFNSEECPC